MGAFDGVAHFDWYAASVPASVAKVRWELEGAFGDRWRVAEKRRAIRYPMAMDLLDDDGEVLVQLLWGAKGNSFPHLVATGEAAAIVAPVLREVLPDHWVSRVDSAVDLCRDNLVYEIERVFMAIKAKYPRVSDDRRGPFNGIHPVRGTTFYLGTPERFLVRGYEKPKEMIDKGMADRSILACPETRGWCRIEAQWRPEKKPDKLRAARAGPLEVWGFAQFGIDLLNMVADLQAPVMDRKKAKLPDLDRAEQWMFRQYSGSILNIIEKCEASPEAVGLYFMEMSGMGTDNEEGRAIG